MFNATFSFFPEKKNFKNRSKNLFEAYRAKLASLAFEDLPDNSRSFLGINGFTFFPRFVNCLINWPCQKIPNKDNCSNDA